MNDYERLLDCFKPGNKNDFIEGDKMPDYENELGQLGYLMLEAVSREIFALERYLDDEEKDSVEVFFDLYEQWAEEKRRHETVNRLLSAIGEDEREEPIQNKLVDALMSYFDGERYYDGLSYFRGLRDDKVTPKWRKERLEEYENNKEEC